MELKPLYCYAPLAVLFRIFLFLFISIYSEYLQRVVNLLWNESVSIGLDYKVLFPYFSFLSFCFSFRIFFQLRDLWIFHHFPFSEIEASWREKKNFLFKPNSSCTLLEMRWAEIVGLKMVSHDDCLTFTTLRIFYCEIWIENKTRKFLFIILNHWRFFHSMNFFSTSLYTLKSPCDSEMTSFQGPFSIEISVTIMLSLLTIKPEQCKKKKIICIQNWGKSC